MTYNHNRINTFVHMYVYTYVANHLNFLIQLLTKSVHLLFLQSILYKVCLHMQKFYFDTDYLLKIFFLLYVNEHFNLYKIIILGTFGIYILSIVVLL